MPLDTGRCWAVHHLSAATPGGTLHLDPRMELSENARLSRPRYRLANGCRTETGWALANMAQRPVGFRDGESSGCRAAHA